MFRKQMILERLEFFSDIASSAAVVVIEIVYILPQGLDSNSVSFVILIHVEIRPKLPQ